MVLNAPCSCFAQDGAFAREYGGIPLGPETSAISEVLPYYQKVALSEQWAEKQKSADPLRNEIDKTEHRLAELYSQVNSDKSGRAKPKPKDSSAAGRALIAAPRFPEAAPTDNTRVSYDRILGSQFIDLERSREKALYEQERKEVLSLEKRLAELRKKLRASGMPLNPWNNSKLDKLQAQAAINEAFNLYKQAANSALYLNLPEFKKSPKQIQSLIAEELKKINYNLQKGPAYQSYLALEEETSKFNKNKIEDMILMSIFTFVALRNLGKGAVISQSALSFQKGGKFLNLLSGLSNKLLYFSKKTLFFVSGIAIYAAIDEANLKAIHASYEEMATRFAFLQDNINYMERIISDGETNTFGELDAPIPSAWDDEIQHRTALRRLYGLRFINTYLPLSTVQYKFDLALLDLFNLFSNEQNIPFDLGDFEQYGKNKNYLTIYASASLIDRTLSDGTPSTLIRNLSKRPAFLYYKKTYYKDICGEKCGGPVLSELDPLYIIRDEKGRLIDCAPENGVDGTVMEYSLNGLYYMSLEPVSPATIRNKPKKYILEGINETARSCKEIKLSA